MTKRHYIIYSDESDRTGQLFSNFFGGALVQANDQKIISDLLNEKRNELNLFSEIKWQRVSSVYLEKYKEFISYYFSFIKTGRIKIRIMFSQNVNRPIGLTDQQIENRYFILYYQFFKHAFGLKYCNPNGLDRVYFNLLLDQIPDKKEKYERFKDYLSNIPQYNDMQATNVFIPKQNITDVDSKKHVILQGLDVILGSISAKLNKKLYKKPQGHRTRSKRTIAKEKLYKHINSEIRSIYPNFNIGISTGAPNGLSDRWNQPYRHWKFIPSSSVYDPSLGN